MQRSSRLVTIFKYIMLILAAFFALMLILIVIGFAAYQGYKKFVLISPAEARRSCQTFYDTVHSDITKVPGYIIIKGSKTCMPKKDESNATDYYFTASYTVHKSGNETDEGLKQNMAYLDAHYPQKQYTTRIENITDDSAHPAICVIATTQIQEDGSFYYPSGSNHFINYISTEQQANSHGVTPCYK